MEEFQDKIASCDSVAKKSFNIVSINGQPKTYECELVDSQETDATHPTLSCTFLKTNPTQKIHNYLHLLITSLQPLANTQYNKLNVAECNLG